ncbi:MAG: 16S rRNA (uracil(1498)-N(3))-methyltransferase [Acidobacteria bacterium]|nr:16S rRNA (uracil(1498)-N(3))-methyltransferase [Acidobacteriota bacterium]
MRRFYATKEQFKDDEIRLAEDETRHLRDVLRLGAGEEIRVFDGRGGEFQALIVSIGKKVALLQKIRAVEPASPESPAAITLAPAILKGEKFELVIQKSVELGIAGLTPTFSARTEVKARDAAKRIDRWRKIALEATKQSGRATLMGIDEPIDFAALVRNAVSRSSKIMFAEKGGDIFADLSGAKDITALIGPEGGWEKSEIEWARDAGFSIVTFGGRILRAETAAIVVGTILQHRFGDLN